VVLRKNYKLFAEKTKREHEIKKAAASLKVMEERIASLKEIQRVAQESMEAAMKGGKLDEAKLVADELATMEKELSGLNSKQKELIKSTMSALHEQRKIANKVNDDVDGKKKRYIQHGTRMGRW